MKNSNQLYKLLEKYKLAKPISSADQEYIVKNRRHILKNILKKKGKYGILFWLAILINFVLRDCGVKLTILQSKIIAGIITTVVASGSGTGVYKTAKYVYKEVYKKEKIEKKIEDEELKKEPEKEEDKKIEDVELKKEPTKKIVEEKIKFQNNRNPIITDSKKEEKGNKKIEKSEKDKEEEEKKNKKDDWKNDPISNIPSL